MATKETPAGWFALAWIVVATPLMIIGVIIAGTCWLAGADNVGDRYEDTPACSDAGEGEHCLTEKPGTFDLHTGGKTRYDFLPDGGGHWDKEVVSHGEGPHKQAPPAELDDTVTGLYDGDDFVAVEDNGVRFYKVSILQSSAPWRIGFFVGLALVLLWVALTAIGIVGMTLGKRKEAETTADPADAEAGAGDPPAKQSPSLFDE